MSPHVTTGCCLLLAATLVASTEGGSQLTTVTDLVSEPEGQRLAVLLPGAQVRTLETRDGWSRVSLEGWIRSEDETPAKVPVPPGGATLTPSAAPEAREAAIAGSIFITDEGGRTMVGATLALRLLNDPRAASTEIASIRAECATSLVALKAEADAMKEKGGRAMKTIENPSQAFEAYDEAKRAREAKLREMKSLDTACGARVETALDARTAARSLSNGEGRYVFDRVPPGRYILHAMFETSGMRHEWDLDVTLGAGERLALDLTNSNRTRAVPSPTYR